MKKEELLLRLSDVISFYVSEHDDDHDKEVAKNIKAVEEVEEFIRTEWGICPICNKKTDELSRCACCNKDSGF